MGTRHLIGVVADGDFKIAQYGQWDGYFSGQGATVCEFIRAQLRSPEGRSYFRNQLNKCRFISSEERERLWNRIPDTKPAQNGWASYEDGKRFGQRYPSLTRDTGAKILFLVQQATEEVPLSDARSFAGDSLFCEFAYILDMDNEVLEVYTGFNKKPVPEGERFSTMSPSKDDPEYYPIRLLLKMPFQDVPDTKKFIEACEAADKVQHPEDYRED